MQENHQRINFALLVISGGVALNIVQTYPASLP
jgi:hypothetical protein